MNTNARIYVTVFLALGFCVILGAFADPRPMEATRFLGYFTLAVIASLLKTTMPAIAGNMSFNFLFILISIMDLTLPQTLVIGLTSTLIESILRPNKRISILQILFAISNMSVSIAVTDVIYRSEYLAHQGLLVPGRIALAASGFFVMNTFPVSAIASLSERVPLLKIWQGKYFWSYPYYILGAGFAFGFRFASQAFGWPTALLALPVAHLLFRTYSLYLGRIEDARIHAEEMAALHVRTIETLALAIEAKDNTTHEHLKRVQVYALAVGKELGLNTMELEALRAASILHDIGKLAVPEHIISKPGRLTPSEFEKMKIHPVVGAEILEQVQFPYPVAPIVRAHHERWDGTGYPYGIRGNDIPIGARILSAVDCLDALASDRQYRRALPLPEAMGKVEADSGKAFDPAVVNVLRQRYVELEAIAQKESAKGHDGTRLSTDLKIMRGDAPAAGFEATKGIFKTNGNSNDFIESVAMARQEMEMLFDIGQNPEYPLRFEESLSVLGLRLQRMIPFEAIAVYLLQDDILVPAYVSGEDSKLFLSLEIPMGQGLSGWVAENRKPIVNGNPAVEPGYLNDPSCTTSLRSALAVPLETSSNVIGVIALYQDARDAFTKDHLRLLETLAPKLAASVEKYNRCPEPIDSLATDRLTGLPHARTVFLHLESELARCKRLNTPMAVLVCAVDGLKSINDRLGRLEGDKILRTVALNIKDSCGEFDYIARLGGNEFVVVLPGLHKDMVQQRMLKIQIAGRVGREHLPIVIGNASYPEDGMDAEQLVGEADRRMFRKKHDRRLEQSRIQEAESTSSINWLQ